MSDEIIRRGPVAFQLYEKSIGFWGPGSTGGDTLYLGRTPDERDVDTLCRLIRLGAKIQLDHTAAKVQESQRLVSISFMSD
jgi:hypothetical protein